MSRGRFTCVWSASAVSGTRLGMLVGCLNAVLEVLWAALRSSWKSVWHQVCKVFDVCYGMLLTRRGSNIHAFQASKAPEV